MELNFLNKDFKEIKQNLINYTKYYFPNTYKDFNQYSPGMMFIQLVSYVGTTLSYYNDYQYKQIFNTQQRKNLLNKAYQVGYLPRISTPSYCQVILYLTKPKDLPFSSLPDIQQNLQLISKNNIVFTCQQPILLSKLNTNNPNLKINSINDNMQLIILRNIKAISSIKQTFSYIVNDTTDIIRVQIPYQKTIKILKVTDQSNNQWYNVNYYTQNSILELIDQNNSLVNKKLNIINTNRKFITKINQNNKYQIIFKKFNNTNISITPAQNTVLNIQCLVGGGQQSSIPQNYIQSIYNINYSNNHDSGINSIINDVKNSIVFNNTSAVGGGGVQSNQQIIQNIKKYKQAINTCITKNDYQVMIKKMDNQLGKIYKTYVDYNSGKVKIYNLCLDYNNVLTYPNQLIQQNVKNYIKNITPINIQVQLLKPAIVYFGIQTQIIVSNVLNKQLTLLKCYQKMYELLSHNNRQINQPIYINNIIQQLFMIQGVLNIKSLKFISKTGSQYSDYSYDFKQKDNIILPTTYPSIMCIKDINDIKGK